MEAGVNVDLMLSTSDLASFTLARIVGRGALVGIEVVTDGAISG